MEPSSSYDSALPSQWDTLQTPQRTVLPSQGHDDVEVSARMAALALDRAQEASDMGISPTSTSSNSTWASPCQSRGKREDTTGENQLEGCWSAPAKLWEEEEARVMPPERRFAGDANVGVVFDRRLERHELEGGHLECPGRVREPLERLRNTGVLARCWEVASREATREELRVGHSQVHLDYVDHGFRRQQENGEEERPVNDLYFSEATAPCARISAGCCLQAAECVARGQIQRAFALIRPPGHHAESCHAMGFCFYNNMALAALNLLKSPGVSRIMLVDWDVHHGNGTQSMLYDDPRVFYVSVHRGGSFYPRTGKVSEVGRGPGTGYNANIPFPKAGFGDLDYLAVFSVIIEPLCAAYAPDIVLVSAGFDAAEHDPLGGMKVSPECYGHMTNRLLRYAQGRVVMALEGGYNLESISSSVLSCIRVMLGEQPGSIDSNKMLRQETEDVLFRVGRQLAKLWPCMARGLVQERWEDFLDSLDSDEEDRELEGKYEGWL